MFGWQKRCLSSRLGYVVIFIQSIVCALLVYALIIGAGDLVVSGCKKIGFYNYLYSKNHSDCYSITQLEDLLPAGETTRYGLVLAIIFTYSSLVIVIMGILTSIFAQYSQEEILWKFVLGLNVISLAGLCLGMTTFLFLTWDLFDVSQVTPGFLALLIAVIGLYVLCCIIRHCTNLTSATVQSHCLKRKEMLEMTSLS